MLPIPLRCLLIAVLCLSACAKSAPPTLKVEALDVAVERFVSDLGAPEGQSLLPWFRSSHPPLLIRRCPDCPSERRERELMLRGRDAMAELGTSLALERLNEDDPKVAQLRSGPYACAQGCCRWETGLLDHGAVYVEEACFAKDEAGPYLVRLVLIDA